MREVSEIVAPPEIASQAAPPLCHKCGSRMRLRTGPTGSFLGCTGFPQCRATRQLLSEEVVELERAENSASWKALAGYWEDRYWAERKFWIANAPNVQPGQVIVMLRDAQCPECGRGLE